MHNSHYNERNIEIIKFMFLFVLSVISVYYFPPAINKIFFLVVLIIFSFSKKNYFWFSFLLLIVAHPLRLYEGLAGGQVHRIPEYNFIGKYGLLFQELFLIIFFIKAKFMKEKLIFIYKREFLPLLILLIFILLSSFYYGIEMKSFIGYFRKVIYFTLFYSVPRLIKGEDFIFIFRILIIFTFLIFIHQIIFIITGFNLSDLVTGSNFTEIFNQKGVIRAYDSMFSQFFVFVFGLAFLTLKVTPFNRRIIFYAVIVSYLSIFLTDTRGYILAFSFGTIFYLFFILKNKTKIIKFGIVSIVILVTLIIYNPNSLSIFYGGMERMGTLENLAEGDASAGGSLERLTIRLPRLLIGIKGNPIFGWGISKKFAMYDDGHVGWANQILQMGILGLIVFIIFWFRFWNKNVQISHILNAENNFKSSIFSLNTGLVILLVIHSTSRTMFNFTMFDEYLNIVIMYFLFCNLWASTAILEEEIIYE